MIRKINLGVLIPVILLLSIGWMLVFSASSYYSMARYGNVYGFIKSHTVYSLVGLLAMFLVYLVNYRFYERVGLILFLDLLAVALMGLTLLVGENIGGATRWISIGGFQFMPIDLAKVALIFSLSYTLSHFEAKRNKLAMLAFHMILPMILLILTILQPSASSAMILFGLTGALLFVGFNSMPIILGAGIIGIVGAVSVVMSSAYRITRLQNFLQGIQNVDMAHDQTRYAILAIASGGIFGVGPGKSIFNKMYISEPQNDMILSTLGEEYGLVGMMLVLALYFILIYNIFLVSLRSRNRFGRYLCFGIAMTIFLQILINMGSTMGLVPPTGIPLPFISYGGTNLMVLLSQIGVVLSVSRMESRKL